MRTARPADLEARKTTFVPCPSSRETLWLRRTLRIVGVGWVVYWIALLVNELSGSALWDARSWVAPFIMWGHGGREYLMMLATDNVAIGAFMVLSARRPLAHRLFIDFALIANLAHMASMIAMAVADSHEHHKLLGDIPLGTLPTLILGALWLRVRRTLGAARNAASGALEAPTLAGHA